jgi:hypothetical protein
LIAKEGDSEENHETNIKDVSLNNEDLSEAAKLAAFESLTSSYVSDMGFIATELLLLLII